MYFLRNNLLKLVTHKSNVDQSTVIVTAVIIRIDDKLWKKTGLLIEKKKGH